MPKNSNILSEASDPRFSYTGLAGPEVLLHISIVAILAFYLFGMGCVITKTLYVLVRPYDVIRLMINLPVFQLESTYWKRSDPTMSDLFRRASEAFHPRQRQGSADSTEAPDPPDARKPSEPELFKQTSEPSRPESHVNEAIAGTANDNVALPKQRRHWGWGNHQGKHAETKGQPSQNQKDNDWIIGT